MYNVYVCMDGWMDGWMDACMHACMYVCLYVNMFAKWEREREREIYVYLYTYDIHKMIRNDWDASNQCVFLSTYIIYIYTYIYIYILIYSKEYLTAFTKILWAKFIILNEHPVSQPFYDIANSQDYENTLINIYIIDPLGTMYIATCGMLAKMRLSKSNCYLTQRTPAEQSLTKPDNSPSTIIKMRINIHLLCCDLHALPCSDSAAIFVDCPPNPHKIGPGMGPTDGQTL